MRVVRVFRRLALVFLALGVSFSSVAAQTCQGMAAFQDGRARVGVDDQYNSDFNDVRGTIEYGVPRSFFGGIGVDRSTASLGGPSGTGVDANLGYQIHLNDTPFQFCPAVTAHFSIDGTTNAQASLGGSLGYRVGISDWFTLVPAAGVWRILTRLPGSAVNAAQTVSGSTSNSRVWQPNNFNGYDVLMVVGLVFNNTLTINPGVLVPSYVGAKTLFTIGVSINWANAVSR